MSDVPAGSMEYSPLQLARFKEMEAERAAIPGRNEAEKFLNHVLQKIQRIATTSTDAPLKALSDIAMLSTDGLAHFVSDYASQAGVSVDAQD